MVKRVNQHITRNVWFTFVLALSLYSYSGFSQSNLGYYYVNDEDGLSNSTVLCIVQDSVGYLWFGTRYGLNRYDGYEVKNYFHDLRNPQSLSNNVIGNLFVDRFGELWVMGWEGISRYRPSSDDFVHYIPDSTALDDAPRNHVMHADEDADGNLWAITSRGHLMRYDRLNDKFISLPTSNPKNMDVHSFEFDPDEPKVIWMGYKNGLLRYDMDQSDFSFFPVDTSGRELNNNIHEILPDGQYLFLAVYQSGVHRFDRKSLTYKSYRFQDEIGNQVLAAMKDKTGRLWFTSTSGVHYYDKQRDGLVTYGDYGEDAIIDPSLQGITMDKQGNLWLGSTYEGAFSVIEEKKFFQIGAGNFAPGRNSNIVSSMNSDSEGNLWVGFTLGLDVLDSEFNYLRSYWHDDQDESSIGNGDIWRLYLDSNDKLWVGSYTGGLQYYDNSADHFVTFKYDDTNPHSIAGNDVRAIAEDSQGRLWTAVHGAGVSRLDDEDGRFTNFDESQIILNDNWTNHLAVDNEDNVWLGSFSGLMKISNNGKFSRAFQYDHEDSLSISNRIVNSIFIDHEQRVWVGTNKGLNLYDPTTNGFKKLTLEDGLPNDHIAAIAEDNKDNLWVSTKGGGIFKLDIISWIERGKVILDIYDKSDGLHTNQFNYNATHKDENGALYFGGVEGIAFFYPDSITPNEYQPRVVIDELKLFNNLERAMELTTHKTNGSYDQLTLHYDQDVITFGFNAFNYIHPEMNQYAYTMEGFDHEWYTVGSRREATYTNLPHGQYLFKVRAANNDGIWSAEMAVLEVNVTPPWWNTLWFRILIIFTILGLIYLLFWIRTRNILIQKGHLEEMVRAKTREIQQMSEQVHEADQAKIRFYMNISHELKTPLSLILGPVKQLLEMGGLPDEMRKQHHFIKRNAERLLRLINELLDLRKLEVGEKHLTLAEGDVISRSRQIFDSFSFMADKKSLNYHFDCDYSTVPSQPVWFDENVLEKVLFNLLSNAFKFTSSGFVKLSVWFEDEGRRYHMRLEDSGAGIPAAQLPYVFNRFFSYQKDGLKSDGSGIGLTLAKELVTLHRGEINVDSSEGSGTVFNLNLLVDCKSFDPDWVMDHSRHEPINQENDMEDVVVLDQMEVREGLSTVLLVEDHEDFRQYLASALQSEYNLILCSNGMEASEKLSEQSVDLVVSDIMMPVMSGVELCTLIKNDAENSHIPVILLTAKSSGESRVEGYDSGADAFISKPFEIQVLKSRIKNLISKREKLLSVFSNTAHFSLAEKSGENKQDRFLTRIVEIVHQNLDNPDLGYKDFVEQMGMSKTKLYRKLGEQTGQSINLFIRTIRLQVAMEMLQNTDLTISEISYKVGFNDPNYFSKCFRQQFDKSPSEFLHKVR